MRFLKVGAGYSFSTWSNIDNLREGIQHTSQRTQDKALGGGGGLVIRSIRNRRNSQSPASEEIYPSWVTIWDKVPG